MDNKEFGKKLEKRTRKFAVKIIHLSAKRKFSISFGSKRHSRENGNPENP